MRTIKKPFRFERVEDIPSVLKAGGCRLLSHRMESGAAIFKCRSAGGVEVRFWVTPKPKGEPAMFCAGLVGNVFQHAIQLDPVFKVLALLKARGFLLDEGDSTQS